MPYDITDNDETRNDAELDTITTGRRAMKTTPNHTATTVTTATIGRPDMTHNYDGRLHAIRHDVAIDLTIARDAVDAAREALALAQLELAKANAEAIATIAATIARGELPAQCLSVNWRTVSNTLARAPRID